MSIDMPSDGVTVASEETQISLLPSFVKPLSLLLDRAPSGFLEGF